MSGRISPSEAPGWVAGRLVEATGPGGTAGTRFIGIDGFGAAGKTTLAARIAERLPGAVVVHVDDFARAGVSGWARELFISGVLEPVLAGRPGRYQTWDLSAEAPTGWVSVPTGVPIIIEGVSALDVRLPVPWDVRLWVEVAEDVRHARIQARDGDRLERWRHDWWPSEQAYAAAQRPWERVDAIILDAESR